MKLYGTVKKFLEPGYGFIVSDEIERDVYFHARDWRSADDPLPGQRVMFESHSSKSNGDVCSRWDRSASCWFEGW
jgi:cold shock CspA family protein